MQLRKRETHMTFELNDLTQTARESRDNFVKLLDGLSDEQWTWKPYQECKSIRETLIHMIGSDRLMKQALHDPSQPIDWAGYFGAIASELSETANSDLIPILRDSHSEALHALTTVTEGLPLDAPLAIFGQHPRKLGVVAASLTSENMYHSGQVAYIRMATDPAWDYYAAMYGF